MHNTPHFKGVLIELRKSTTSESHSFEYVLGGI